MHASEKRRKTVMLTKMIRQSKTVPLAEPELLTHSEHLSSPSIFNGVDVARSLVFCVVFCR